MRTRPGRIEPEIYFRIVHAAQNGHNDAPVAAYREQTVEIALGPKDIFINSNIGALTRWVPAGRMIRTALPPRGKPKPPRELRTPRVVELLRKAMGWQDLIESGKVAKQSEIARREGITRARVTQIMGLLRLAPEIQKQILSMPGGVSRLAVTERMLRPVQTFTDSRDQVLAFRKPLA